MSRCNEDILEELTEAFHLFDPSQSGFIELKAFRTFLKVLGFKIEKENILPMLRKVHVDIRSNRISFDDVTKIAIPLMVERDPKEQMETLFNIFDEEGKDRITFQNLKNISKEVGAEYSHQHLVEMFDEVDRDGDGVINRNEFFRVMNKMNNDDFTSDEEE